MRISHVYQPAMLKVCLNEGGEASIENVAKALLSHDQF
jgi:hypothetical protein